MQATSTQSPTFLSTVSLTVPKHVSWEFNGRRFAEISNYPASTFKFTYSLDPKLQPGDLQSAIDQAVVWLHERSGMKLALCVSGADSEIIARSAAKQGVPCELFFLDVWGVNARACHKAVELAAKLEVKLNVFSLSKAEATARVIPESYELLQAEKPTYLCLPYLLERIPKDMYIVGGEGDPQKSGLDYEPLANADGSYNGLPISSTEVFYRQWALLNNRACEMYFYASTPELLKAYFYHPLLEKAGKEINTRRLVDTLWPDLLFSYKTTNWEDSFDENVAIRQSLRSLNLPRPYRALPLACLTQV